MVLDVYWIPSPAEGRAIFMTCRALGVPVNMKLIDTMKGDQKSESFLKMNPLHTLPTLDDDGFYLWESRSILRYLANKYAKSDDLYPTSAQNRAKVDMMLDYDLGTLSPAMIEWVKPQAFCGEKPTEEQTEKMKKALDELGSVFLANFDFLTGESLTIADLACVASITYLEMVEFDFSDYPAVKAWLDLMKQLPYFRECNKGLYDFIDMKKSGSV